MQSSSFFFNDTATTEIYTLSLHDALPISSKWWCSDRRPRAACRCTRGPIRTPWKSWRRSCAGDRKSTRLNSSHDQISYAVFCLKKKKQYIVHHAESIKHVHKAT